MHKVRIAILPGAMVLLGACGGPAEQAPPSEPAVASEQSPASPAAAPTILPPATAASQEPAAASSPSPTASSGVPAMAPSAKATAAAAAPSPGATAAVAGQRPAAFAMCASCHSVEPGRKGVGPSLHGVVGRTAGTQTGYNYSPAMKAFAKPWTEALLDTYLAKPSTVVPGTKMVVGVPDATRRKAVIEYLATLR